MKLGACLPHSGRPIERTHETVDVIEERLRASVTDRGARSQSRA